MAIFWIQKIVHHMLLHYSLYIIITRDLSGLCIALPQIKKFKKNLRILRKIKGSIPSKQKKYIVCVVSTSLNYSQLQNII